MNQIYLTAIIHTTEPQIGTGNTFLKYRNIKDDNTHVSKFLKFAQNFPGADYVNLYYKHSRKFKERIYLW